MDSCPRSHRLTGGVLLGHHSAGPVAPGYGWCAGRCWLCDSTCVECYIARHVERLSSQCQAIRSINSVALSVELLKSGIAGRIYGHETESDLTTILHSSAERFSIGCAMCRTRCHAIHDSYWAFQFFKLLLLSVFLHPYNFHASILPHERWRILARRRRLCRGAACRRIPLCCLGLVGSK